MYCVNCGERMLDDANFCHACGAPRAVVDKSSSEKKATQRTSDNERRQTANQENSKEYIICNDNELVFRGRRFLARTIDYATGTTFFLFILLSSGLFGQKLIPVALLCAVLLVYVFEAFCISSFGATPSKAVFGIRVIGANGNKPSFKNSATRSFNVWIMGVGCNVPLIDYLVMLYNFFSLSERKVSEWDRIAGTSLACREIKELRFGMIILYMLCTFLFMSSMTYIYYLLAGYLTRAM